MTWAVYDGDVPIMLALRSILGVENDRLVEKPSLVVNGVGPLPRTEVEAQSWVSQQSSTVGHTDGEMGWRGKRLDKAHGNKHRREDVVRSLLESMKQAVERKQNTTGPGRQRNQGTCLSLNLEHQKLGSGRPYHTGTSASSTARAGTSCKTEQRKTRNLSSTLWVSCRFLITS